MAITGISAISGEQIIAAGAVSAKEAGTASFTTGGNDIQNLYDTVSTNSASWTGGGSSTVYVDSTSVLGGDGTEADPLTLRYDTNTLDKATGSTTVTLTAGADGCAIIEANSDLAVYMGSHAVSFNFQGIGTSGSKRYIGMSLTPVGGGDTLYLDLSGSINAYSSECTVTIDTREQPDWATRVQWDSTKSWKIYMNEDEDPWPQITYTSAATTIPGGSYALTIKNPLPSTTGHYTNDALVIDNYGNAVWSSIRTVPTVNVAGKVLKSNSYNTYTWGDVDTTVNTTGCIIGDGSTASPVNINIDTETLEIQSEGGTDLPIVNGYAFIAANSDIAKYMRDGNTYHTVTFTMSGFTPSASTRTVGLTIERLNESYYVPGFSGTLQANATSCTITVDVRDYAEWGSGPFTSDHDWVLYTYEDDEQTYPAMPYTSCTHNGPAVTVDKLAVKNPVPAAVSGDAGKFLSVIDVSGNVGWVSGGGASYTGDAQGALDEVYSKSANWNTAYGTLASKSAFWDSSYYAILMNSGDWARDYTGGKNITVSGNGLHATVSTTDNISVTGDVAISNSSETFLGSNTSEEWGTCETPINSLTGHYKLEFGNLNPTTGLSISVEDSEDWQENYTVSNLTTADLQDFAITSLSSVAGASVSTAGTWTDLATLLANGKVNVLSTDGSYRCSAWRIDSTNVSLSGLNDFVETNSASWTGGGASYTGDAQGALDEVYSNSANWDGSYDTLTANSATWTSTNNTVSQRSGNWNNAYTTVTGNSAAWGGQALPISAGPGVKMDIVNDTLVFSNDETVLWENTTSGVYNDTITLNEPWSGFNKIGIEVTDSFGWGGKSEQFDTLNLAGTRAKNFSCSYQFVVTGSPNKQYIRGCQLTFANNEFTSGTVISFDTILTPNTTIACTTGGSGPRLVRIIGINRTAST